MLAGLYVVRCYISCLPRLCSVLLHGEKKHKKWFMNINEQAGIPNLNCEVTAQVLVVTPLPLSFMEVGHKKGGRNSGAVRYVLSGAK